MKNGVTPSPRTPRIARTAFLNSSQLFTFQYPLPDSIHFEGGGTGGVTSKRLGHVGGGARGGARCSRQPSKPRPAIASSSIKKKRCEVARFVGPNVSWLLQKKTFSCVENLWIVQCEVLPTADHGTPEAASSAGQFPGKA